MAEPSLVLNGYAKSLSPLNHSVHVVAGQALAEDSPTRARTIRWELQHNDKGSTVLRCANEVCRFGDEHVNSVFVKDGESFLRNCRGMDTALVSSRGRATNG